MCEPYISHTAVQTIEIKDELKNEQVLKNIIKNLIIQRIRYIHMPLNEIENEYQSEIIENPFVEVVDIKAKGSKSNIEKHSRSDYLSEYKRDIETRGIDWEGYFKDIEKTSHRGDYSTDYCDAPPLENIAVAEETLYDHLVSQLYQVSLSEKQINIGKVIIGFIDRKGFLTASSAEIAAHADLRKEKATVKEVNAVITAIQEFDPSGVCARNAAESIQLQYRALCRERSEQIKFPEKIEKIINNYFNELARKKYEDIAKNLSIDIDQVKKCVLFIVKNFTPWPGLQYASDPVNASVKPEVFIEKTNGGYSVTVEEFKIPEIRLNPEYMKMLKRDDVDQSVKDLINRKLNRALFIKKSIEQRRETIKKVVECIALMQKEYLDRKSVV